MKRMLCLALAVIVVMTSVIPVMAAVNEPSVSPRYTYIQRLSAGLTINETLGLTACTSSSVVYGADSVKLTCSLQQHNGSYWITIKSWNATTMPSASIAKNYAVYSGYTYRVKTSCSVYNSSGTLLESGVCYSNQVVY